MKKWRLLAGAFALAAGAVVAGAASPAAQSAAVPLVPTSLVKYIDALPIPPSIHTSPFGTYELHFMQGTAKFHRDLPPTPVYGYGDGVSSGYLGPTFEARSGVPINVRWVNDLPSTSLFQSSMDYALGDGMMGLAGRETSAVTHLHGGHVADTSDGGPDAWLLPGQSASYLYDNDQQAATLWYHDHALGVTRFNPYGGLAGFYVIRNAWEDSLNLPKGQFEVPLVIQDKTFSVDASAGTSALTYPTEGILPAIHPAWQPEFFGDTIVVNGKAWPYLNVEPRKYRFRILDGSNARFYSLSFVTSKEGVKFKPVFNQIGAEGGLMPATATFQQLLIAPGERADVIVDFSGVAGTTVTMKNNAKAPYPAGESPDPQTTGQIMQFRVAATVSSPDTSVIPAAPAGPTFTKLTPTATTPVRNIKMREVLDPATGDPTLLQLEDKYFHDPVTIKPKVGATEVWRFINTTGDTHPMHTHLVQFQVLSRQNFDVAGYLAASTGTPDIDVAPFLGGAAKGPAANETGWKDTVKVNPGEVVSVIATFDRAGTYPVHCHILEHEENEMMRPFTVEP